MFKMSNVVRIKHTANAQENLKNAYTIMEIAARNGKEMESPFNQWAKVQIRDKEVRKLLQLALCPNKETYDLFANGADKEISNRFANMVDKAFDICKAYTQYYAEALLFN